MDKLLGKFLVVDRTDDLFLIKSDAMHSWTPRPEHATQFDSFTAAMNAAHAVHLTAASVFGPIIAVPEVG